MNIVQVVPKLNVGGLQKVCIGLSNSLSEKGMNVHILSLSNTDKNDSLEAEISSNVKLTILRKLNSRVDLFMFFKTLIVLIKLKPNVVHTHGISLFYLTLFVLFNRKVKVFHTVHNLAIFEAGLIRRKVQKFLFSFCNVKSIVLSHEIDKSFLSEYGFHASTIIPNSAVQVQPTNNIDLVRKEINKLKKNSHTRVLIHVGRISKQKNQLLLIKSFIDRLAQKNAILLIIGGTSNKSETNLLSQLKLLSDGYSVYFLGNKLNVSDYLLSSDIFCLSSSFEGFPISILEALSAGLPIISTKVGGVADIITSDKLGIICVENEYSNSLEKLTSNYKNYNQNVIKKHFTDNFTYDISAKMHINFYQL